MSEGIMASLGRVLSLFSLHVIGVFLLAIGGIVGAIETWRVKRKNSIVIFLLVVFMITLTFVT
ncbi:MULTISPECIES: hypothetical protein [Priestia]|uniref:hypothetical protein n=1 Tax=Priestia TaxID=2800373 RepID=UPI002042173B|nr:MULTISPECIES: hypothetical protein [Priestia]MCM3773692.1 hypothetical protein [Priestia aryabhattai]MDY0943063.1 hypothetical protein [Priestia megaterium]